MATFQEYLLQVERFFVVARMSGLVLSPKDMEKVRQYYLKGVPLHLVLMGIHDGLKTFRHTATPGQRFPHSLSFYSHFVAPKIRRWNKGAEPTVPRVQEDPRGIVRAYHHLKAEADVLLECEQRPHEKEAKALLVRGLGALEGELPRLELDAFLERLASLDAQVMAFYDAGLAPSVRHELSHATQQELSADKGLGTRALEGRFRVVYARRLRDLLGVPVLHE